MQAIRVTWAVTLMVIRATTRLLKDNVYYTLKHLYMLMLILSFYYIHEQYLATYEWKEFNRKKIFTLQNMPQNDAINDMSYKISVKILLIYEFKAVKNDYKNSTLRTNKIAVNSFSKICRSNLIFNNRTSHSRLKLIHTTCELWETWL